MDISRFSIKSMLLLGIGLSSILFVASLGFALHGMDSISGRFQSFIEVDQKRMETLRTMQAEGSQVVIAAAKKVLVPDLKPPLKVADKASQVFTQALDNAQNLYASDPQNKQIITEIEQLWQQTGPKALEAIRMVEAGNLDEGKKLLLSQVQKSWGAIRKKIQPLILTESSRIEVTQSDVFTEVRTVMATAVALGLVALIVGLFFNLFTSQRVTRNVCRAAATMERIADGDGDLTQRLDEDGLKELSRLASGFNRFTGKTQLLIQEVTESVEQ